MASKSAKYDFTKTMRNISYSSDTSRLNQKTEFYNVQVDIKPSDKVRLERFFKEETSYYNHLINGFSSRVRSFPEHIIEFDETWQKIFGYVAESKQGLKKYVGASKNVELPDPLVPYRKVLLSNLTERKVLITDLAAAPGLLLPVVRKNMAIEMLRFYREQAQCIMTPGNINNVEDGNLYKVAPEMLEEVDCSRKRHLQIPKTGLIVKWNAIESVSEIYSSYTAKPIIVPRINLIESNNWNYVIVHQEPGRPVNPDTPWIIDIKKLTSQYMLKYLDMKYPARLSAFDVNKRKG